MFQACLLVCSCIMMFRHVQTCFRRVSGLFLHSPYTPCHWQPGLLWPGPLPAVQPTVTGPGADKLATTVTQTRIRVSFSPELIHLSLWSILGMYITCLFSEFFVSKGGARAVSRAARARGPGARPRRKYLNAIPANLVSDASMQMPSFSHSTLGCKMQLLNAIAQKRISKNAKSSSILISNTTGEDSMKGRSMFLETG